jgi:hypothetical protein
MAIRIRADGEILCAAMHPEESTDVYFDDGDHHDLFQELRAIEPTPMGRWKIVEKGTAKEPTQSECDEHNRPGSILRPGDRVYATVGNQVVEGLLVTTERDSPLPDKAWVAFPPTYEGQHETTVNNVRRVPPPSNGWSQPMVVQHLRSLLSDGPGLVGP